MSITVSTWGATVPGTYPTPEAGTCTPYVQYVGPGGKPPCASGTYPTREAGTRSLYVPNGGPGAYVSAQAETDEDGHAGGGGARVLLSSAPGAPPVTVVVILKSCAEAGGVEVCMR